MAEPVRKAVIFCACVFTMIGMGLSLAAILTPSWQVVNLQEYNSVHEHGLWLDCTRHSRDSGGVLLQRYSGTFDLDDDNSPVGEAKRHKFYGWHTATLIFLALALITGGFCSVSLRAAGCCYASLSSMFTATALLTTAFFSSVAEAVFSHRANNRFIMGIVGTYEQRVGLAFFLQMGACFFHFVAFLIAMVATYFATLSKPLHCVYKLGYDKYSGTFDLDDDNSPVGEAKRHKFYGWHTATLIFLALALITGGFCSVSLRAAGCCYASLSSMFTATALLTTAFFSSVAEAVFSHRANNRFIMGIVGTYEQRVGLAFFLQMGACFFHFVAFLIAMVATYFATLSKPLHCVYKLGYDKYSGTFDLDDDNSPVGEAKRHKFYGWHTATLIFLALTLITGFCSVSLGAAGCCYASLSSMFTATALLTTFFSSVAEGVFSHRAGKCFTVRVVYCNKTVLCAATKTVAQLMAQIEQQLGIAVDEQRLLESGQRLSSMFKFDQHTLVDLFLAQTGGMEEPTAGHSQQNGWNAAACHTKLRLSDNFFVQSSADTRLPIRSVFAMLRSEYFEVSIKGRGTVNVGLAPLTMPLDSCVGIYKGSYSYENSGI